MIIGKLVRCRTHLDYVAQTYRPGELEVAPQPEDYALGTFVRVTLPSLPGGWLVGLICDTTLLNPEYGQMGPRLSTPVDLAVFPPNCLQEKAVLIGITIIGQMDAAGQVSQDVLRFDATSDSQVERLTTAQILAFHGGSEAFTMSYVPRLLAPLELSWGLDVLAMVLDQLRPLFPRAALRQVFDLMIDDRR